jgi:hypothetical protein
MQHDKLEGNEIRGSDTCQLGLLRRGVSQGVNSYSEQEH